MKQLPRRYLTARVGSALLLMALVGWGGASKELRLGKHDFDWSTVDQERAHFRWSAEVINDTTRAFDVVVAIDLLNDDDVVVYTDRGSVSVVAGQVVTVEHEGSMPFDGAAAVVSFRFRLVPSPPTSRRQPQ